MPGLAVECDGAPVDPLSWSMPFPVDRGRHVVAVTAPGKQRWEKAVEASAEGTSVPVEVPLLAEMKAGGPVAPPPPPAGAPAPAARPVAPVAVAATATPSRATQPPNWSAMRTAGVALAGVGLVGVAVGSVFGGMVISKKNQSNADGHCGPPTGNFCDATGQQLRNDGLTDATISTALFIPGLVLAAGGVTLFVLGSRGSSQARVGVGPGSVSVSRTW